MIIVFLSVFGCYYLLTNIELLLMKQVPGKIFNIIISGILYGFLMNFIDLSPYINYNDSHIYGRIACTIFFGYFFICYFEAMNEAKRRTE